MFVGQEVTLDLSFAMARARLLALTAGGWLRDASGDAFSQGYAKLAPAGPSGGSDVMPGLALVRFLPPQPHDQVMIVPLRWEAAGRTGDLIPVLDADVALIPAGAYTRLAVSASYRLPAQLADAPDKLMIRDAAAVTVNALLCKIATRICPWGTAGGSAASCPSVG